MSGNEAQIEYWNGAVGEHWAAFQPVLDKALAAISDAALAFAAAKPGERVLDIGCGTGTTTYALAKAVGPGGSVTGVDISRPMLAAARARGTGVNFREGDASVQLFHPTHDLVFSRFGVMFFDDPVAAFANIRKAVAPHGRLAFVCWRSVQENLWASVPIAAALPLLPPQEPADPLAPGPFAFADSERLKDILSKAGYRNVRTEKLDSDHEHGRNAWTMRSSRPCASARSPAPRPTSTTPRATRSVRPCATCSRNSPHPPASCHRPHAGWWERVSKRRPLPIPFADGITHRH